MAMATEASITPRKYGFGQAGEFGELIQDADPHQEGEHDAEAAALGDRPVVCLAWAGAVHQAGRDHQPYGGGG